MATFTFSRLYGTMRAMKRLLPPALAGIAVFLALSCGSVDPASKYPNMVANADPVSAGTFEAEFERLFSARLNKAEVEAIFYPRLNAVALEFRYELIRYRQFWDEAARNQFAQALERYKTDYEARTLVDRYGRTRAAYGKLKGRCEWETFRRLGKTRVSYPSIELGYRFREKAPFFATLMRSAREANPDSGTGAESSAQINMYFTRAQADELVRLFDQAYLMGLLAGPASAQGDGAPELDDYREYGE